MAQHAKDEQATIVKPEADLAELQSEIASLKDRLLRALADADNVRRRAERTAQDARQYAIADFARELLPVLDNLQRAIATAEEHAVTTKSDGLLLEGVAATARLLMSVFDRFGIEKVKALGERFDPNWHEAVSEVEDESNPSGTVMEVIEDGYRIHDRLLRPARVVVAKRPAQVLEDLK